MRLFSVGFCYALCLCMLCLLRPVAGASAEMGIPYVPIAGNSFTLSEAAFESLTDGGLPQTGTSFVERNL